ncbi:hypothetical protein R1CP_20795 [Rhodococcus opacus]|uniref:Uncharacterized protein n=1 Tax=Rhodococcus opacus TaxID=37919 RepID=A0A1B1K8A2_RHOOP|nr:hypothetical protein R1CP_20795 [Rhodococcus opacus]
MNITPFRAASNSRPRRGSRNASHLSSLCPWLDWLVLRTPRYQEPVARRRFHRCTSPMTQQSPHLKKTSQPKGSPMVADRHSHRQHNSHRSTTSSEVDVQIGRYQRHCQRERQEQRARERRPIPKTEADVFIRTALTWVPYGGVPEDDIFQMFGMSRSRFIETLWHTVRSVNPEKERSINSRGSTSTRDCEGTYRRFRRPRSTEFNSIETDAIPVQSIPEPAHYAAPTQDAWPMRWAVRFGHDNARRITHAGTCPLGLENHHEKEHPHSSRAEERRHRTRERCCSRGCDTGPRRRRRRLRQHRRAQA